MDIKLILPMCGTKTNELTKTSTAIAKLNKNYSVSSTDIDKFVNPYARSRLNSASGENARESQRFQVKRNYLN